MQISPIVAHTTHYKRPANQSYVYYSPPKQQFSSWDDNTTLRDLLIAAVLLLGINSSESAWNNRTPEFSLGKTEYAGPKQPWWKHLWNGAKGTVIGGTQSERVELLETQAQASELASRVALTELRKFYNKNPQPGMTFEQWKAQVLRPEINKLVRTKLGLEIKKDQPEPTSDLEDY